MNFIDRIKSYFDNKTEEEKQVETKQAEEIAKIIAPVFREIPPQSKTGKFLTEGFRSWAFIAISAVADEIATTQLNILKKQGKDWVEIDDHQALKLIEKPNNFQTKEDFLWLASIYWLSEGEAPIYLNSAKNPTEMVLLNPERLSIMFDNKNIIGGYKYRKTSGGETTIDAENLLMLKMPSVVSPFRGTGIMKYVAQTLDIDNYIEEYLKLFFFNDTTPGAVLETDQELTQSIIERLKHQFVQRHRGVKNSHKLSILEKGLKYHKISSNINELQLKELNDLIRDKILASFKVPKSILGIVEDVNRASAEASSYSFSKRAVLPRLKMIESQLNQFLLPKFSDGENLWFSFDNPVFEDKLVNAQVYALGVQNGWLTANEVREEIGLEPLEEDNDVEDKQPIKEEDDTQKAKYAKPKKKKRIREKKRPEGLISIMKDILEEEKLNPKKFYTENELIQYHQDKIMFLDFIERDFKEELRKLFRKQKRKILKQIEGKSVKANSLNLQLDLEEETLAMIKVANPYLYEAVVKESKLAYSLLGLRGGLSKTDDLVKNFIEGRTLKLGKSSSETTQAQVDRIVKDWIEKGGAWTELRDNLENYFDGEEGEGALARADMIARTELSFATGFAQNTVYEQTGAIGKQWLTAVDERVCPMCEEMNDKYGEGMIVDINENFFDKGDILPTGVKNTYDDISTPPIHPSCRCDIIPIYAETKSNKIEMRKKFEHCKHHLEETEKKEKLLLEKEAELSEKEKKIKDKESKIKKEKEKVKKEKAEVEKNNMLAKKELKKIKEFSNKLDGELK